MKDRCRGEMIKEARISQNTYDQNSISTLPITFTTKMMVLFIWNKQTTKCHCNRKFWLQFLFLSPAYIWYDTMLSNTNVNLNTYDNLAGNHFNWDTVHSYPKSTLATVQHHNVTIWGNKFKQISKHLFHSKYYIFQYACLWL
jgi:hypothetical protein